MKKNKKPLDRRDSNLQPSSFLSGKLSLYLLCYNYCVTNFNIAVNQCLTAELLVEKNWPLHKLESDATYSVLADCYYWIPRQHTQGSSVRVLRHPTVIECRVLSSFLQLQNWGKKKLKVLSPGPLVLQETILTNRPWADRSISLQLHSRFIISLDGFSAHSVLIKLASPQAAQLSLHF